LQAIITNKKEMAGIGTGDKGVRKLRTKKSETEIHLRLKKDKPVLGGMVRRHSSLLDEPDHP